MAIDNRADSLEARRAQSIREITSCIDVEDVVQMIRNVSDEDYAHGGGDRIERCQGFKHGSRAILKGYTHDQIANVLELKLKEELGLDYSVYVYSHKLTKYFLWFNGFFTMSFKRCP